MSFPAFQADNYARLISCLKKSLGCFKTQSRQGRSLLFFIHYWNAPRPEESTRAALVQAHGGVIWLAKLSTWAALGARETELTSEVKKTLLQTATPANPGVYNTLSTSRVWEVGASLPGKRCRVTNHAGDATNYSRALTSALGAPAKGASFSTDRGT